MRHRVRVSLSKQGIYPLLLLTLWLTSTCYALPEDSHQTIQLKAGSADLNEQTHLGTFIDNVALDQGSTHIRAARAVTEGNEKNQLEKATLTGNTTAQAHYWTLTTQDKAPLHAYADTIYFYPERHRIELIGNARVEQANNSFTAPLIIYDMQRQHIVSKQQGTARTTIIFHPERGTNLGKELHLNNPANEDKHA